MDKYHGPHHVWSNIALGVISERREGQRFEVTHFDAKAHVNHNSRLYVLTGCGPLHMISGSDHILVSDELRSVLQRHCGKCVQFETAAIVDGATGRPVTGYAELRLPHELDESSLFLVEARGQHAWRFMKMHLYVSERAKVEIQRAGIIGLIFSPGFSDFLGGRAAK